MTLLDLFVLLVVAILAHFVPAIAVWFVLLAITALIVERFLRGERL